MLNRPTTYMLLAIALGNLVPAMASAETRTVVRTRSAVLARVAPPAGVIPGTLGSTLLGYRASNTIEGALERQNQAGQLAQLRAYNGRLYYGSGELNGTLPLLDQVNWLRWQQMDYKPQVMGPMTVVNNSRGMAPAVASTRATVMYDVPLQASGLMVVEYGTTVQVGRNNAIAKKTMPQRSRSQVAQRAVNTTVPRPSM